jgi:hypothetical protein
MVVRLISDRISSNILIMLDSAPRKSPQRVKGEYAIYVSVDGTVNSTSSLGNAVQGFTYVPSYSLYVLMS